MNDERSGYRNDLLKHILPSSATMVGVCITALSVVKLAKLTGLAVWVSHSLALCSVIFLSSSLFSYFAMRAADSQKLERVADMAFLQGLTLLSLSTVYMAIFID